MAGRILIVFCVCTAAVHGQLTLGEAVRAAMEKYPEVRARAEDAQAAAASIRLARTTYLPRADLLAQLNRASHNNVFGLMLPQAVIPSISGPVLETNSLGNVWGSAAGLLVSWEPFDFGLRRATVEVSEREQDRATAETQVARWQTGVAAADAFLTAAAARETVRAARAGVERARVFSQIVEVLVKSELRPGVEASRARAELALAEVGEIRAGQAFDEARAALGRLVGTPGTGMSIEFSRLLAAVPETDPTGPRDSNPLALAQNAAVAEAKARQNALDRAGLPRFNLQAASYARGTGIRPTGRTGGAASGLAPDTQNWAVGMTVTFPALEGPGLRARREIERHRERAAEARYENVLRDLDSQLEKSRASLVGARRVAGQMPTLVESARAAEQQASARYRAGLGTLIEVAEAQRLLTQAEIDAALARLNVWRALLAMTAVSGDVEGYVRLTE